MKLFSSPSPPLPLPFKGGDPFFLGKKRKKGLGVRGKV